MAWPTPALDGLLLTENSNGRRWLHALCQALNEREGCLGLTKTEFVKADGTEAADISFADLEGGWIGGANDCAITNLNRCMTGLKAMLSETAVNPFNTYYHFLNSSGSGGSSYTLAALQTAVGLGAFPNEADSWTDLNFWKQLKSAFDLLIYCRKELPIARGNVSQRTGSGADVAAAWADAYTDTPSTVGGGSFSSNHLGFVASGVFATFREGPTTVGVNSTALAGVLTESYLRCQMNCDAHGSTFPAGWTIGGIHITSTTNADVATTDITLGANDSIAFDSDSSAPSSVPLPNPGFFNGPGSVLWATLYYDIETELTDQA